MQRLHEITDGKGIFTEEQLQQAMHDVQKQETKNNDCKKQNLFHWKVLNLVGPSIDYCVHTEFHRVCGTALYGEWSDYVTVMI